MLVNFVLFNLPLLHYGIFRRGEEQLAYAIRKSMAESSRKPASRMEAEPEVQDRRDLVQVTQTRW